MAFDARLIISLGSPRVVNLSKSQQRFLKAVRDHVTEAGFQVQPDSATTDDVEQRLESVRQCHGVIVLAFSQWNAARIHRKQSKTVVLPSEFNHLGVCMAVAARRPLLVLREKVVTERGSLRKGYVRRLIDIPNSLDPEWLKSQEFKGTFENWKREVNSFRHVFLGYSSQASDVANTIRVFLAEKVGVTVFDWHDFRPGDTIWDSIERAESLTNCGIFLFMADDRLGSGSKQQFAPRDNVVYEAGYFAGAKGRQRSLIIREKGAKVPTDLGGILYLELANRGNISEIETKLREKVEQMLDKRPGTSAQWRR